MEKLNKGLTSNFELEGGKFKLIGGEKKIIDGLIIWSRYIGWFRIMKQDFCLNPYYFYQQTTSFFNRYKNIFKLNATNAIEKHIPMIDNLRVGLGLRERKVEITFNFTFKGQEKEIAGSSLKVLINE